MAKAKAAREERARGVGSVEDTENWEDDGETYSAEEWAEYEAPQDLAGAGAFFILIRIATIWVYFPLKICLTIKLYN